jgi:hypothetical protein
MPTWVRHVTGTTSTPGFWTATKTETFADNCSAAQKTSIMNAFNSLSANPGMNCLPALRDAMRSRFESIPIDCCFDETRPPRGGDLQALIFVCNMTDAQIQAELCQGLVRGSGGTTLDVKAMLMSCFGAPQGIPTGAQFNEMVNLPQMSNNANERIGEFCIWNRSTGEVFDKTTTTTGGFWTSSTVVAKGGRCFINSGWVF